MTRFDKLYKQIIIEGKTNISFSDIQFFVEKLGFRCRIKGDHFVYTIDGLDVMINLQPSNKDAKPYQVKQIKKIVEKYKLGGELGEE